MSIVDHVRRFFFGPVSVLPLVMLRIVTGVISFAFALLLFSDLQPLLTYLRVPSDGEILWWQFIPSLSLPGVRILCALLLVSSALLIVGAFSRASAWSVFFLTLALQRYNPSAFNGGDFILRGVLQMGVALGPSGDYLSVDAARRRRGDVTPQSIEAWPLRFIQLHISVGYLLTFYLKTRGHSWLDGTALWYALNLSDLARFHLPTVITAPPSGAVLTWLALASEAFVGIGVWWRRTRPAALVVGVGLHLAIMLTMEIGFFSIVMIASYLAFMPDHWSKRFLERWRSQKDHELDSVTSPLTVDSYG
jgi:hypothetical protein